jgi:hypothetical protein
MITQSQMTKAGYTVLPKGAWFSIDPETIPEWDVVADQYGFDPNCKAVILCVAGFKEVDEQ